jgi:hypothetical protein
MISAVDASIGTVVARLREYGMYNNTCVAESTHTRSFTRARTAHTRPAYRQPPHNTHLTAKPRDTSIRSLTHTYHLLTHSLTLTHSHTPLKHTHSHTHKYTRARTRTHAQCCWAGRLIIFSSDNGGPDDHANNYPLRGSKGNDFQVGALSL